MPTWLNRPFQPVVFEYEQREPTPVLLGQHGTDATASGEDRRSDRDALRSELVQRGYPPLWN